jgi:hypothetical protein
MAHDADVLRGAAVIADALLERLSAIGIAATTADIEWNGGRGLLPAPEFLQLKIKPAGAPAVTRVFRRGDLEDAARRITWFVQHHIDQIAYQYGSLTGTPAATPEHKTT